MYHLRANAFDVRTAYEVVHRNEIAPAMMQVAAQKTQQAIANSVMANKGRASENGVSGSEMTGDTKADSSAWTKADREEVRRRVKRGEKIFL